MSTIIKAKIGGSKAKSAALKQGEVDIEIIPQEIQPRKSVVTTCFDQVTIYLVQLLFGMAVI